MKKTRLLVCIALTAVLVTAVTLAVTLTARAERRAAEGQAAVYHEYQQLLERAASYAVTVSENGAAVGTYTLADLGVFEGTRKLSCATCAPYRARRRRTPISRFQTARITSIPKYPAPYSVRTRCALRCGSLSRGSPLRRTRPTPPLN